MEIRTPKGGFSEVFKKYIVEEIETGRMTAAEANRKYDIFGHSTILRWRRKYGSVEVKTAIRRKAYQMDEENFKFTRLQNEIKSLRQELDSVRMKNVVLETFVDIAEQELGIPIRKKYGAEQSGQ